MTETSWDVDWNRHAKFEIDALVNVAREALSEKSSFDANLNDDKKQAIAEILRLCTSEQHQGCRTYHR